MWKICGYKYDYKARKIDKSMYLGCLPIWVQPLAARLRFSDGEAVPTAGYMQTVPDQLIVNEYDPGQGISAHVDCISCFGASVCSLTLGSGCMMKFTEVARFSRSQSF